MELFSSNIRILSSNLYPFRCWLLASWLVFFTVINVVTYLEYSFNKNILLTFFMWPFFLWSVTFVWGKAEENKYKKVQLFMLPYALGTALGLFTLVPFTIWGILSI